MNWYCILIGASFLLQCENIVNDKGEKLVFGKAHINIIVFDGR